MYAYILMLCYVMLSYVICYFIYDTHFFFFHKQSCQRQADELKWYSNTNLSPVAIKVDQRGRAEY